MSTDLFVSMLGPSSSGDSRPKTAARAGLFFRNASAFLAGLVLLLWLVDAALGWSARHSGWHKLPGTQVFESQKNARASGPRVRSIYLGDSVARQLFRPGLEPNANVRYLPSTGAIAMAGQFYLLEESVASSPHLTDVYLFLTPGALSNDLSPPYAYDYFCEFFHQPAQIAEVFQTKRDANLLAAHVGRLLLPNLMAENSRRWVAGTGETPTRYLSTFSPTTSTREPLLDLCNWLMGTPTMQPPAPGEIVLSPTSRHYLPRMRALCGSVGAHLHVLACPVSDDYRYWVGANAFDAEILYLPASEFRDGLHLKPRFVAEARQAIIAKYKLDG